MNSNVTNLFVRKETWTLNAIWIGPSFSTFLSYSYSKIFPRPNPTKLFLWSFPRMANTLLYEANQQTIRNNVYYGYFIQEKLTIRRKQSKFFYFLFVYFILCYLGNYTMQRSKWVTIWIIKWWLGQQPSNIFKIKIVGDICFSSE